MFKNRDLLIRNLATLCIVCNMLYWIFPFPAIVWRVGLVLLAFYVIGLRQGKRQLCENAVLIFAIFNLVYFFISYLWMTPSTSLIGNILCALLSLSLFSYLAERDVMTNRYFSILGIVLLVAAVFGYYHMRANIIENLLLDDDADVTNNATTIFAFLIPMIFFIERNFQKWLILIVCLFFLISGAKRGNLIVAIIPVLLVVIYMLKDARRAPLKITMTLLVIVATSFVVYRWFSTNEYLIHRIELMIDGNSSGRDVIYEHAWQAWSSSNSVVNYLFGFGYAGTTHHPLMQGKYAHNDWFEILVDYGLVGVVLYVVIFISFVKQIRKTKIPQLKMVLISTMSVWFLKTIFSMGFVDENLSILMISLGSAVGLSKSQSDITYKGELVPR